MDTNFVHMAQVNGIKIGNVRAWCHTFTQVFNLVRLGNYGGILPIFCASYLPAAKFHCFEPSFMKDQEHKIVLAWNHSLLKIRKTSLQPFIDLLAEDLKIPSVPILIESIHQPTRGTALRPLAVNEASPLGRKPR